jgi:hypothetical protein
MTTPLADAAGEAPHKLGQRLEFEELLSALSRAFVAVVSADVDAEIKRWAPPPRRVSRR